MLAERGTARRLREALAQLAEGHGRVLSHDEKPWASVTFSGARHRLQIVFEGHAAVGAGERFVAFLPEHEFALPGQLVADATVTAVDHALLAVPRLAVTCELLLLEEG